MSVRRHQCAWCPWDCPSPEVAACREKAEPFSPVAAEPVPGVLEGLCEPRWVRARGKVDLQIAVNVIRDLADYEPQPTAEAVDGA